MYKLLNLVSKHQIRTLHISALPLAPWRQVAVHASFQIECATLYTINCISLYSDQTLVDRLRMYPTSSVSKDEEGRVDRRELLRRKNLMLRIPGNQILIKFIYSDSMC